MEFANFKTLVREEVERRAGADYSVRLNDVMKNNGVILSGITLMQDDSNISPTIYLNNYYEDYENGETTLGMVINDVIDVYNRNKVNRNIDMRYLFDYESVKKQVVLKLINTEKNRELLSDVPHLEFLDLSIVFQVLISDEAIGSASVLIHNAHTKLWGVDQNELYKHAVKNTPRLLEYEIKSMNDVISEIMKSDNGIEDCSGETHMYVLSNSRKTDGAACMLYPELIGDFAKASDSDLYIIPSSIHELLLLPAWSVEDEEELKNIIKEVNETQLLAEEVLSDSLYFYDKASREIKIF